MRKGLVLVLAAALLAMFAVPAMAEFNFSGFIKSKLYFTNYERYDAGDIIPIKSAGGFAAEAANPSPLTPRNLRINTDAPTATYFEERARLKFEAKTDTVGAVAFFEIDFRYGDAQYSIARNSGGAIEADTINLETKNLYVWFKPVPNTTLNVGLQNFTDAFRGVLLGYADIAGVVGTTRIEPIDLRYGWTVLKHGPGLQQGAAATAANNPGNSLVGADANNSTDFYLLEGHVSPVKDIRVGLDLYMFNDHDGGGIRGVGNSAIVSKATKIYTVGADGSFKVGPPLTLSAFAFYQFGKADHGALDNVSDIDVKGWTADVRADLALGPGKGFIEAIYISGDDNPTDTDYKGIVTGSNYALAAAFFASTDMEILLPNLDDINTSQALTYDTKNFGQGLLHVGAGYTIPLGKFSLKVGAGHSRFAKASSGVAFTKKTQGTEANLKANYSFAKGLDVGLTAAYAWLGDAYDVGNNAFINAVAGAQDPDNLYKLVARVNYAF